MTLTRVSASKNLPLAVFEAEARIDAAATRTRARFATTDKHTIYLDKRSEAERFLAAVEAGGDPRPEDFPYLSAETGVTAPTMIDLANLWIFMDRSWKQVAATIETISVGAKAAVRAARGPGAIDAIVAETIAALDAIGDKPPDRPKAIPALPGQNSPAS